MRCSHNVNTDCGERHFCPCGHRYLCFTPKGERSQIIIVSEVSARMVKTLPFGDLEVPVPGYGAMGLSHSFGYRLTLEEAEPVLLKAIELGCTFWDTAVSRSLDFSLSTLSPCSSCSHQLVHAVSAMMYRSYTLLESTRSCSGTSSANTTFETSYSVCLALCYTAGNMADSRQVASKCGVAVNFETGAMAGVTNSPEHIQGYIGAIRISADFVPHILSVNKQLQRVQFLGWASLQICTIFIV